MYFPLLSEAYSSYDGSFAFVVGLRYKSNIDCVDALTTGARVVLIIPFLFTAEEVNFDFTVGERFVVDGTNVLYCEYAKRDSGLAVAELNVKMGFGVVVLNVNVVESVFLDINETGLKRDPTAKNGFTVVVNVFWVG